MAVACALRVEVALAGFFRGFGNLQLLGQQRFDGGAGGLAGAAVQTGRVVGGEQAAADGFLAQQFGAGALAQRFAGELITGGVQRHTVDAGHGDRGSRNVHRHGPFQLRTGGALWPCARFILRERTTWYGRNR